MMKLRPYQTDSIDQLRASFKRNKRTVLCLPTGAGKTVVFSEMVRMAAEKGTITLVLTDRIELFEQTLKSMARAGVRVQRLEAKGNRTFDTRAVVTVGMVETVKRRWRKGIMDGYAPQLIITDEAHKATFNSIYEAFTESRVIGATATPQGKHFYKYFTDMVQNIDIPELIEKGYLMPCRPFQMQDDLSDLDTRGGEYTDDSLFGHFNKQQLYDGVIDEWKKRANGKKTIVFNVNIAHTVRMTEAFNAAGIRSECVTSHTPKDERERILSAFKAGLFPVLNNCGILTTGYDEPSIECVVMNRATKSLPLWLQCCGRGSRPCPEIGKEEFVVLDFGMNHDQHGLWAEPRKWAIKPPRKKKELDVAPVKECPQCQSMVFASARTCRHCGYIFPFEGKELAQGVMVEVGPKVPSQLTGRRVGDLSIPELLELEKSKAYKSTFIWRIIRSRGKSEIEAYARAKGYSQGWVYRQQKDMANSEFKNYVLK